MATTTYPTSTATTTTRKKTGVPNPLDFSDSMTAGTAAATPEVPGVVGDPLAATATATPAPTTTAAPAAPAPTSDPRGAAARTTTPTTTTTPAAETTTTPAAALGPAPAPLGPGNPVPDFADSRMPVADHPGYVYYHNGQGWEITSADDAQARDIARYGQADATARGAKYGTATDASGAQVAAPESVEQLFTRRLQELLGGPSADEVAEQASNSPQARAYQLAQKRNFDRQAAVATEQNAAGGGQGNNAGLGMALRGLRQQQGEGEAGFLADLATQKQQARRDELQQAMAMAQEMGENEKARALQLQIANIDASVRNRGYDVQERLGQSDLDLRKLLGLGDLDLRRYGLDLGHSESLDDTAFRYDDLDARSNNDALKILLGG